MSDFDALIKNVDSAIFPPISMAQRLGLRAAALGGTGSIPKTDKNFMRLTRVQEAAGECLFSTKSVIAPLIVVRFS